MTPPPTLVILHRIDLEFPNQPPNLKVPPLCRSIRRLQYHHGSTLLPPDPEMEALQFSLRMSSQMAGRIPGLSRLPYQHSIVHISHYQ